ncbi:LANO_0B06172g1_1 [Lachancea nothofagi CBS 11611]|uniref:LANO_0B06172g1_1 n=1 Tax=Lachancea nothofagi CBS 11611 TaxID=1266666 RepID=A0A1G4IYW9_9SACH|nr:LANO_0B06172g1_1 [Lachancea nothofagi CBS 11611]
MSDAELSDGKVPQGQKLPIDKPWFKEAYESALKFYAKDDILDTRDRLELSKTYVSIARAQLWGGWTAFTLVFGTPFALQLYKTKAIKGVKVPRNFVFGLIAMGLTAQTCGKYMYNFQLSKLDPNNTLEASDSSDHYGDSKTADFSQPISNTPSRELRQYEMLKLLGYGMAPKWGQYFYSTYTNPDRRLPDPKAKLQEMQNNQGPRVSPFLNQRDPLGLYSGPKFDKKEGIPQMKERLSDQETPIDDDDPLGHLTNEAREPSLSSWQKVRHESGVVEGPTGDRWTQIRSSPSDQRQPISPSSHEEHNDFETLLEKERRGEDSV